MGGMFPRCMMRLDKFKCEYPPSQQEQAGQTWCLILSPLPTATSTNSFIQLYCLQFRTLANGSYCHRILDCSYPSPAKFFAMSRSVIQRSFVKHSTWYKQANWSWSQTILIWFLVLCLGGAMLAKTYDVIFGDPPTPAELKRQQERNRGFNQ